MTAYEDGVRMTIRGWVAWEEALSLDRVLDPEEAVSRFRPGTIVSLPNSILSMHPAEGVDEALDLLALDSGSSAED